MGISRYKVCLQQFFQLQCYAIVENPQNEQKEKLQTQPHQLSDSGCVFNTIMDCIVGG